MDSLSDKTSIKMVKKALNALPKGLKALDLAYDGAMQRIDSQLKGYRHLAKQLLGWLIYLERIMSVQEIQYALAIEPGESSLDEDNLSDVAEIVGFCAGLVIVDRETIRLVHYTTQEYFRQNDGKFAVATQQDIAICCLTYLLYEEFGDGWVYEDRGQADERDSDRYAPHSPRAVRDRLQKHPFLGYAARYWSSHASVCDQQNVIELTMNFARHDHKVSSVGQLILVMDSRKRLCRNLESTKSRSPLTVMHLLAYIGNKAIFSRLLNHGFEADSEDSGHRTPLWWATEGGQYAMVKFLLSENRVNVNGACHPLDEHVYAIIETPLHVAAYRDDTSTVKLLLDRADIDVNSLNSSCETPLCVAVTYKHTSIVELLLDCADTDVNLRCLFDVAPLNVAATRGSTSMVKLLCAHPKIDLESRDDEGRDVFALVKERQETLSRSTRKRQHARRILAREACVDIIRAAIEERKSASSAHPVEQCSEP